MKLTRVTAALAVALSFALLTGCASNTPDYTLVEPESSEPQVEKSDADKAAETFQAFNEALNEGTEAPTCEADALDPLPGSTYEYGGWGFVDDEEIVVEYADKIGMWSVRANMQLLGGDERIDQNSANILIPEDGEPCVQHFYGFTDLRESTS